MTNNINKITNIDGYVHSVETMGATDGPGIRTIFFLQGCPLRCSFCHNPDTWTTNIGRIMSATDVLNIAKKYLPYTKNGGITLSGGEPLLQPDFCLNIIDLCKNEKIHTAIDTSGFIINEKSKQAILNCDIVLLDIKSIDKEKCERLTGQSNENALNLLDFCENNNKQVWIRHVVVPDLTYNYNDLTELAKHLKRYSCIEKVELLPFHQLGKHKWDQLQFHYKLKDTLPLTPEQLATANKWFYNEYNKVTF